MPKILTLALLFSIFVLPLLAQAQTPEVQTTAPEPPQMEAPMPPPPPVIPAENRSYPHFEYTSYGYFLFSQEQSFKDIDNLKPYTRRSLDMPEFAVEGRFNLTPKSALEFEIEFEHYGAGTALEFDNFEEFGEFETETEKGGEVVLHEIYYEKELNEGFEFKVGKAPVFISLSSVLSNPMSHPNIEPSDMEYHMLPVGWTEPGVQFSISGWRGVKVRAGIVGGLDSEYFNAPTWIGNGHQRRFESTLANNFAGVAAIEIGSIKKGQGIAIAGYRGDSSENRYKLDKLKVSSEVTLVSLMMNFRLGRLGVMGQSIRGDLENSQAVSNANSNMPAKVKAQKPYVGAKAALQTLQLAYYFSDDISSLFIQKEHVNTFEEIQGNVYQDPYYDREMSSAGFSFVWDKYCFLKVQYGKQKTRLPGSPETDLLRVAMGFDLENIK